jgi:hypothetical protein
LLLSCGEDHFDRARHTTLNNDRWLQHQIIASIKLGRQFSQYRVGLIMLPHNVDFCLDGGLHSLELEFLGPLLALARSDRNLNLLSDLRVWMIRQRHRLLRR